MKDYLSRVTHYPEENGKDLIPRLIHLPVKSCDPDFLSYLIDHNCDTDKIEVHMIVCVRSRMAFGGFLELELNQLSLYKIMEQ